MKKVVGLFFTGLIVWGGGTGATENPTAALGQKLFESPNLGGARGTSCADCHPGGKGLEEISAYSDSQLKEMINFCIRDAQKGEPFPLESQELQAILLYLRALRPR